MPKTHGYIAEAPLGRISNLLCENGAASRKCSASDDINENWQGKLNGVGWWKMMKT